MPLKTRQEYVASLRDGREVWFRGARVDDVTTHPVMRIATDHAAIDYRMAEDPAYRDLAVIHEDGREFSRFYKIPRDADDLLKRSQLIEAGTTEGDTLVILIKEIGTDAIFALFAVTSLMDGPYAERVRAFYEYCRDNDLAVAVAQTDVKGDRRKRPSEQADPDLYLRVIDRRDDGVVVRGAKVHTSASTQAHEIVVLPTRAMGAGEEDWSIAFALPVNTPGLRLIASPYGDGDHRPGERPVASRHKMMETITIFDDVFIPNDRIFLNGEREAAGQLALTFVEYHRFTAVSYKLPLLDALNGAAALIADANGIVGAGHVRDKFVALISYAETVRGLTQLAAQRCISKPNHQVAPDPMTVNLAKSHFAHGYHEAVQHVQELAGGLLVTGPGDEDWASEELRPFLSKYLAGRKGIGGEQRIRMMNFIRDLTSSDYGAYQEVLAIHAEGSLEAEKLQIFRAYQENGTAKRVIDLANRMAGV
ncbi:MAG: gamma-aminobutyrate dehydratase [Chloroflexi bacterium]|nr:gamma-aminobutyrate dehydratase [Chloroflexota bacterium]